jgi:putative ABC transport system substrate-binding protein
MTRREFITLLGGAAMAWPSQARAQQRGLARIGALHPFTPPHPWVAGLRQGLRELGYVEGRTITIEERGSDGHDERLDVLAQGLVDSRVDILVVMTGPALWAARRWTNTVPIVIAVSSDGVGTPGVASLARPGGNVTGLTLMGPDLAGLRLSMLKDAVPTAKRIAVLYDPGERPSDGELGQTQAAAKTLGVVLQPLEASSGGDLEQAFASGVAGGADALITFAHSFSLYNRGRIAELAAQHACRRCMAGANSPKPAA